MNAYWPCFLKRMFNPFERSCLEQRELMQYLQAGVCQNLFLDESSACGRTCASHMVVRQNGFYVSTLWDSLLCRDVLTISRTSHCFDVFCSTSVLKTLRETEKLLETSNFSFSHSVFYLIVELSAIFIKFEIVVC